MFGAPASCTEQDTPLFGRGGVRPVENGRGVGAMSRERRRIRLRGPDMPPVALARERLSQLWLFA